LKAEKDLIFQIKQRRMRGARGFSGLVVSTQVVLGDEKAPASGKPVSKPTF
jgi:hypothetical protein